MEALVAFLTERAVGRVVARVDLAALSVLKTYDPPVTSLQGLEVASVSRHGKFLDLDVSGLHLVVHLARAGWLRWSEELSPVPPRMGKGPLAARVHLDDGSGFDLTEAGTQKRLAMYVVHSPYDVPGVARLGPDPLSPGFGVAELAAPARRVTPAAQGPAAGPVGARRGRATPTATRCCTPPGCRRSGWARRCPRRRSRRCTARCSRCCATPWPGPAAWRRRS